MIFTHQVREGFYSWFRFRKFLTFFPNEPFPYKLWCFTVLRHICQLVLFLQQQNKPLIFHLIKLATLWEKFWRLWKQMIRKLMWWWRHQLNRRQTTTKVCHQQSAEPIIQHSLREAWQTHIPLACSIVYSRKKPSEVRLVYLRTKIYKNQFK